MRIDGQRRYTRLLERYRAGTINRRTFLGLVGIAGIAAGVTTPRLAGLARTALAQEPEIRFDGWGGIVSEALRRFAFDPYEAATGATVVDRTFGAEAEVFTAARAGQQGDYHLIHSSGVPWYKRWIDAGYGVVLNENSIPNLSLVMARLIEPLRTVTPDGLSAVPYDYGTTGLAFNTTRLSPSEAAALGPDMLLLEEFAGRISGDSDWQARVWYGALLSGQDPNAIEDIDAVWDKVRRHRDLVNKYYTSGAELMDLLATEEVFITDAWSGRVAALQQQGYPIGYLDPPGSLAWMDTMLVLKGAPLEMAEELLNFMLEPETAIAVAEGQNYPPSLDPTKVTMTDTVAGLPAFDPTGRLDGLNFADPVYWTNIEAEWKPVWQRIERGF